MADVPVSRYPSRVRSFALASCLALFVAAAQVAIPRDASALTDFDPSGRGKKKPPKPGGGRMRPGGERPSGPKRPPKPEPEVTKGGPSCDALIARYTAIVLTQPSAPFPLQRLAQLYRERDGNL